MATAAAATIALRINIKDLSGTQAAFRALL
jgi:hypothetical protein